MHSNFSRRHFLKLSAAAGLVVSPAGLLAVNAVQPAKLNRFEFSEPHMGTTFRIVLYAADEVAAKKAVKTAFARVAELNAIMSDYQPTSELMTVLPMVMIPVYLVPLSIVLHLASLAKLRREAVAGNGFSRAVAA